VEHCRPSPCWRSLVLLCPLFCPHCRLLQLHPLFGLFCQCACYLHCHFHSKLISLTVTDVLYPLSPLLELQSASLPCGNYLNNLHPVPCFVWLLLCTWSSSGLVWSSHFVVLISFVSPCFSDSWCSVATLLNPFTGPFLEDLQALP